MDYSRLNHEAVRRRVEELRDEFRAIHNDTSKSFVEKVPRETELIDELVRLNRSWCEQLRWRLQK